MTFRDRPLNSGAAPLSLRKASGFPLRFLEILEAMPPEAQPHITISPGKAEPFRTSGGKPQSQLWRTTFRRPVFRAIIRVMSILIAEDNVAQRHYLREILEKEFPSHAPIFEASDGEETVKLALEHKPQVSILDIQMPKLSGVKAARAIWREFPSARIIFWTQFPHEIYINEIRKIVKSVDPPPAYGFIHKNNPESRFLRFVAAVLEDGADMIDPAFKDSFKRPLLTEFESEALYYLALGLSNWAIARKCSLSLRGVESRLATLYEKLFVSMAEGTEHEAYEKLAYNVRTRAFFEALRRGLLNNDELEKAAQELEAWIERDQKKFIEEQKRESGKTRR
jgi:DNA-binding NarL/FixJ family response regulator